MSQKLSNHSPTNVVPMAMPTLKDRGYFLRRERFKLGRIVELASHPEAGALFYQFRIQWRPKDDKWGGRFDDLAAAVRCGDLKASSAVPEKAEMTLGQLWEFCQKRPGDWGWLRDFCRECAEVSGTPLEGSAPAASPANAVRKPKPTNRKRRGPGKPDYWPTLIKAVQYLCKLGKLGGRPKNKIEDDCRQFFAANTRPGTFDLPTTRQGFQKQMNDAIEFVLRN
jgi:hypothetical protein